MNTNTEQPAETDEEKQQAAAEAAKKVWFPKKPYDPVRFRIGGIQDTPANLKTALHASELHAGLKSFLADEIDKFKTNAGEIHLHDIELLDNTGKVIGFTVNITVKQRVLGASDGTIASRAKNAEVAPG